MKKTTLALLMMVTAFPVAAENLGSPTMGAGANVYGHSSNSAPIATPSNVADAASWTADVITDSVNTQITNVGNDITSEIQKLNADNSAQSEANIRAQTQAAKDQAKSDARIASEERYAPESMGSSVCTGDKTAAGAAAGANVRTAVESKGRNVTTQHLRSNRAFVKTSTALRESLDKSKGGARNMVPPSGTATKEEFNSGTEYINTTIEPTPPPELPENVADTTSKETYENLKEWRAQHLELPSVIMNGVHARTAPSIPVENATLVWQKAGFAGEPTSVDGKISIDQADQLIIDSRLRSSLWHSAKPGGIRGMSEKGLLVEIAEMQAFMLDMINENNKLQRQVAMIQAERRAEEIQDRTGTAIKTLYSKAISGNERD